jgi:TATA-binding protein-associated factor
VWQTLARLLAVEPNASTQLWVQEACAPAMRHAFQGALLDVDAASADAASEAWVALLRTVPIAIIEATFTVHGAKWCELATSVANARGEGKLIFVSTPPSVKGEIRAVAKDWPATTAGRMRGLECLARLAAAFGAHERSSSVARMEQHIVGMLTGELATARLAGAHLLTSWLRVVPPGPQRPTLQAPGAQLGAILANTNPAYPSAPSPTPYGEVAQMVKYVKSESMAFLRVAATNGVVVTGEVPSPEADGFGADSAATLSAAVPQVRFTCSIFSRFGVRARRRRRLHVRSAPRALCAWYFMRFHHMGLVSRASDERLRRVQLLHKNEAHRFPQS